WRVDQPQRHIRPHRRRRRRGGPFRLWAPRPPWASGAREPSRGGRLSAEVTAFDLAREQERRVVGGFLWALLVLLVVSNVVDSLRLGRGYLRPEVVAANLAVVAFVLGAVVLNRQGRTRLAITLAAGLLMLAASALPLSRGLA